MSCFRLFFAGFLSTAGRGAWSLHDLLTQDPSHITRVRADIDRIVTAAREIGPDEPPRVEDHDFLNACFTETARIHPIGTWLRWAEQPFALPPAKGSTEPRVVPPGFVAVTTESIRNDPDLYGPDYEKYDPTRYYRAPFVSKEEYNPKLNQGIRLDSVRAPPLNMTSSMQPSFGVGAHQCAGRLFAYRMVTTFITTLFESFDVELVETEANADGKHKMVYTPLFGSRELMSDVTIRLRRREVSFE
jgi:cytochrome P450